MTSVVVTPRARPARRVAGVHSGQIVATQAAAAGVLLALGNGALALGGAGVLAVAVLASTWLRVKRRWLYQWLGLAVRYAGRRRTAPSILSLANPGGRTVTAEVAGEPAAVIEDAYGVTAVLALGDPGSLFSEPEQALPTLPNPTSEGPPVRLRLVCTAVPAPVPGVASSSAGNSYRQLTEGRLLSQHRTVLAVQVLRTEGTTEPDLRRALDSAVRRVRRRLAPHPVRLLTEGQTLGVLHEAAQEDGARPARETWHGVHAGGLFQATFRLRRAPSTDASTGARLIPRLLALPAAATTVTLTIGPESTQVAIRLTATNPAALSAAAQALRRTLSTVGAAAHRLDGEHALGLAATLPIGGPVHRGGPSVDGLRVPSGGAGLALGVDRYGKLVSVRLFRSEPTRVLLVGGLRTAQLLTMRALAAGAAVVTQTARPHGWEPFARGAAVPGSGIAVVPPGRPVPALANPGTPLRPQLVIVDAGPIAGEIPVPPAAWRAVLVVRDELTPGDLDALGRADLAILPPMGPVEAGLAATALGLGAAGEWLTRIRGDMIGVVNRRAVRWALLSATTIEEQVVAPGPGVEDRPAP